MLEVSMALCWKGRGGFPRVIRPKKECIKSYETYFTNTLNLNKGPSMKWVCSPKFYGPLTIWPWLRISPHSSLNVIYCLIISDWQWLMSFMYIYVCICMYVYVCVCIYTCPVFLCKLNPIKACPGKGQGRPSLLLREWRVIPFPPQDFCSPCEFI